MFLKDKKQTFWRLIGDSYRSFKPLYKKILPIFIVNSILTYGLSYLAFRKSMGETVALIKKAAVEGGKASGVGGMIESVQTSVGEPWLIMLIMLLQGLIGLYFSLVIFNRADGVLSGDKNKIIGAWSAGLKRLIPNLGYIFAILFIYLALGFVFFILSFILPSYGDWTPFLLFIAAGISLIILTVRLLYSYPLIASRQKGVFDAIRCSFRLTKGYFWKLSSMYSIVLFLPGIGFGILTIATVVMLPPNMANTIIGMTIGLIQSFVITTLNVGALYVFLNDCLAAKKQPTNTDKTG